MPSVSKAQQHFMAGWEHNPDQMRGPKPDMTHQQFHDFAATPTRGLPQRKMAMGGMVPPGRQAQNRAIHASRPSMQPGAPMRSPQPLPMPAPMPRPVPMPMPNPMGAPGYLGRYPAMPPRMAAGGPVPPENYYAQGGMAGEADVSSANGPVLPNQPAMQQSQGVGYSQGGDVLSDQDRDDLPSSDFAVPSKAPGSGSYPMPDRKHAAVAKGYAKRFGSPAVQAAVAAKAKSKFGMSQGGPVGTDEQTDSPGPEKVKVNGRAARVARFEKENGDREV